MCLPIKNTYNKYRQQMFRYHVSPPTPPPQPKDVPQAPNLHSLIPEETSPGV